MYNYYDAMMEDVRFYLDNDYDWKEAQENGLDLDELREQLYDDLWTVDSVTGNGSGSYTFNSYRAKEYVTDNEELLQETVREFCIDAETVADRFINGNWEYFDVSIRCYLLGQVIDEVIEEYESRLTA